MRRLPWAIALLTLTLILSPVLAAAESAPVVRTGSAVLGLSWDSSGGLFAYMEEDTVLLRSSEAPYRHLADVELPGVIGFLLYHEDGSGVQVIGGSSDGTVAVWTVPDLLSVSPPPLYL